MEDTSDLCPLAMHKQNNKKIKNIIYYWVHIMNHYILWINCTTCHLTWLINKIKNNTTLSEQLQNLIKKSIKSRHKYRTARFPDLIQTLKYNLDLWIKTMNEFYKKVIEGHFWYQEFAWYEHWLSRLLFTQTGRTPPPV